MNLFHITFPRDPRGSRVSFQGASPELIEGFGCGFVFSPFGTHAPIFTIPFGNGDYTDRELIDWCAGNDRILNSTISSDTRREEHLQLVGKAVEFARETENVTGKPAKVIAARVKAATSSKSLPDLYRSLADAYPDACVFLFSSPISGTWIGASPELLCHLQKGDNGWMTETVALAGTRPAGSLQDWDDKNIREQRMVADFILSCLEESGLRVTEGQTVTRRAGNIEHIMTPISAIYESTDSTIDEIAVPLLRALSPTPALCGHPREKALDFILSNEGRPRDFYGGYLGIVSPDTADIYVNLRSGRVLPEGEGILLYAGGGITRDSIPDAEWMETERKLSTIMTHL